MFNQKKYLALHCLKSIALILIFFTNIFPQKELSTTRQIYISKNYTENGEPVGLIHNKEVEAGTTYSIILSNKKKNFIEHLVFLNIEKRVGKNSLSQFVKLLRTEKGKTWVAFNYTFSEEGVYEIYFTDFTRKRIAELLVTVKPPLKNAPGKASIGEARPSLKVIFCDRIIGGSPIDHRNALSISNNGGETYIYITDDNTFKANKFIIGIWKKNSYSSEYGEFVDSKKFKVNFDWHDTFFKYRFETHGKYKIDIFDENEILLKTAYIAVEK